MKKLATAVFAPAATLLALVAPAACDGGASSGNSAGGESRPDAGAGSGADAGPGTDTDAGAGSDTDGSGTDIDAGSSSGGGGTDSGGGDGGGHAGDAGGGGAAPAARPAYNKGTGFFVSNGKLYDANGNEFRIRGIDKLHWDNGSPGLANSKANTVRWNIDFTRPAADNVALLQGGAGKTPGGIHDHMAVMPGAWDAPAGTLTCSSDASILASAVSVWVAQAAAWNQLEKYSIINIGNEWGPSNSTVWRDSYVTAIGQLRAAGYHATLSITSGGCGQDNADLAAYAKAVFDSDPEKNVIFDRHVYGGDADVTALSADAASLAGLGLPVIFGEFGPGNGIGPSPTNLTPAQVIQVAEQYGFGWLAWAWDDNDLSNAQADNEWFALSYAGAYGSSADLTMFGQQVVEGCTNPAPGGCGCPDHPVPASTSVAPGCKGAPAPAYSPYSLKTLAVPATIF
jgi:mannan endo-1,4-beta-mannosidase